MNKNIIIGALLLAVLAMSILLFFSITDNNDQPESSAEPNTGLPIQEVVTAGELAEPEIPFVPVPPCDAKPDAALFTNYDQLSDEDVNNTCFLYYTQQGKEFGARVDLRLIGCKDAQNCTARLNEMIENQKYSPGIIQQPSPEYCYATERQSDTTKLLRVYCNHGPIFTEEFVSFYAQEDKELFTTTIPENVQRKVEAALS